MAEIPYTELQRDSLTWHHRLLLLLALAATTTLDALRVLLEHGYPEHAFGLTRRLYDLEVDVSLLVDDPTCVDYYLDYVIYDLVWNAGEGERLGDLGDPDLEDHLDDLRTQLGDAYDRRNLERPPDFETKSLSKAAADFAKKRWKLSREKRLYDWRPVTGWKNEILRRVSDAQLRIIAPDLTPEDEEYVEFVDERKEAHFFFGEMSSDLHSSPKTVVRRGLNRPFGDDLEKMQDTLDLVAIHFVRIHHLVCTVLGIDYEADWWNSAQSAVIQSGR